MERKGERNILRRPYTRKQCFRKKHSGNITVRKR